MTPEQQRNAHINRSFAGQINQLHSDVRELNERLTKQQADMLDTIVKLRAELTRWQSLAERLATALDNLSHDCHNHAKDIIQIRWGYDGDCGSKLSAEQIEECCDAAKPALAAYESAKSDPLPDPLAEAVKRMEEVTDGAIEAAYWKSGGWVGNIRALLISAAKGEQP